MFYSKLIRNFFSFETRKINSEKPIILKAFTVWNENMMFSMNPIKATYVEKNNYYAIKNPGWILMEIVPVKKQNGMNHLEWDKKKQFSLGVKQIGQFLQTKQKVYDEESKFQTISTYTTQQKQKKQLKVQKNKAEVQLTITQDEEQVKDQNAFQVTMTLGEYITVLELINFSLPFLLGWDALYTPQFSDNDIQE